MEEASVAGESPDRSRQRESSEQPTPGSTGPVPEARSESVRDPRLGVAKGAAATPAPAEPRGAADADRATKVFSVRGAAGSAEGTGGGDAGGAEGAAAAAETGAAAEAGRAGEAGGGPGVGVDTRDGRLREAVAAWVATADTGKGGKGAEEAGEGPQEGPEGSRGEGPASRGGMDRTAEMDAPSAAGLDADADDASAAGAGEPRADGTSATDADRTGEPGEPGEDDADVSVADEAPEADAGEAAAADAADQAPEDEPRAAVPGADARDEASEVSQAPEASTADADGDAPRSDATAEPTDAEPKDAAPATGPADAEPTDEAGPEDAPPATGDAEPKDGDGTDGKPGARRVDQPTAVFTAVRPPVDQPTTMLKLGDAAKPGSPPESDSAPRPEPKADARPKPQAAPGDAPKAQPTPGAQPKPGDQARPGDQPKSGAQPQPTPPASPGAEAERTSRFVALKPLDEARPVADATRPVPQLGPERTTQQPLPPKPPLDLLAELTNTPPPPDTPLRTLVRRVKIWTPLVLLLVIVFAVVQSVRPLPQPTLDLTAQDSYTFDGGRAEIPWPAAGQAALDVQGIGSFGSSGAQKPVPIASVAKVMTAYLVLRDHPIKSGAEGPKIKIDQAAEDQSEAGQESTVKVTAGDSITEREALESILIASANNVARLLARWDAGSEKAFVDKMNAAAEDLGMTNTTYTDPSGLNNTTVSTAVDQVKLAKAAMKQPVFREVAAMMSYVDYKGVRHNNWNQLVGFNDVVGIKTGTTTSALGNLVFAAKKKIGGETRTVVGAVVRQPAGGSDNTILQGALSAGDRLIRAAQDALESATILRKGTVVGYADDGLGGRTPVAVTEDVKAVGWAGLKVKLTFAGADLPHTGKAGAEVGTLTVGDGTSSAVKVPVALQEDLAEPGFTDRLTRIT
ncbi:D-alanyl-D-alanine carboxypeptidase [Streptomyces sp. NPDC051207]|uniref:D-alanyl-D-alanine carboxypeptidase n=1 Tax=Streptomyces sp. NPDC051207 TaxID=3154641 RepID=UPI0034282664